MNDTIPLTQVSVNEKCIVKKLLLTGLIRRRLLDLGLIEGTVIEVLQASPFGDPVAYLIRGAVIAIRFETASNILVEVLPGDDSNVR